MNIEVRYFASLREALGDRHALSGLPGDLTVAALRAHLCTLSPEHARVLASSRAVRCAVNKSMADDQAMVPDGAEVAFFPPVTGG